ncbi:hypothetical protein niasHT_039386 [Heterodera trifolii]|uniref:Uncharacterized protein n=1 Tax=Heterodera trifolii TaxID=157864 RepID=A0ABD2I231_9BILA
MNVPWGGTIVTRTRNVWTPRKGSPAGASPDGRTSVRTKPISRAEVADEVCEQCRNANCAPEAECNEGPQGPVCRCLAGFLDVSAQHGKGPGKVCRLIQNECNAGKHDCSRDANCIDTADAFTCRCKEGFRDDSPGREKSGRVCTRTEVPDSPECDVNDPMSCDKGKHEACLFISGSYHCSCPMGYGRLPDGRCLAINECDDARLNECSEDAECIDQAEAYTCKCKSGFADISPQGKPGTLCRRRINECAQPQAFDVDCDANAICIDTEESFSCRCRPGFADISEQFNKLPGRRCVEAINECLDRKLNDCSENAQCEDSKEGYTCKCRAGFLDASENAGKYPGRVCIKSDRNLSGGSASSAFEFAHDTCDPKLKASACKGGLQCTDRMQPGTFVCACPEGQFLYTDGTCRLATACVSAECDKNAICVNVFDSFRCQCKPGYWDMSPDPETKPGRACKELINECATDSHDCSPFAECVDATDGYACVCRDGFVDSSSQYELLPGRKCSNASNECTDRSLNTCDENADCVDTPAGYSCKCIPGYVDVSSSANLPPGRVCTVVTTCPKQKTDLMFLIDGSGSIGSAVFRNEVLRFVRDFVELFDIGLENTRVGLIQYSDQIRHEFDLNQYVDKPSLLQAIAQTQYLTGLTRTGAAIQHMVVEGFSERRGARPVQADVSRVAIVITDGRSQDNVTEPAKAARHMRVNMFSIGVTDHVLASELEAISGSAQRWFYVDRFKDLDMRLRSIVQKLTCPQPPRPPPSPGGCSVQSQIGCDRTRNEHCELVNGKPTCRCPGPFARHPQTGVCGGDLCNPELPTSCPHPELCAKTPFSNFRCVCPAQHSRDHQLGICLSSVQQRQNQQHQQQQQQQQSNFSNSSTNANFGTSFATGGTNQKPAPQQHHVSTQSTAGGGTNNSGGNGGKFPPCAAGTVPNPRTGKCAVPGSCDPAEEQPCDVRKREKCLLHSSGQFHACQCLHGEKRHPATEICLRNECLDKRENDCDRSAKCIDTDESYICACPQGFLDQSSDPMNKPGRLCVAEINECALGQHRCSPDAICEDTPSGYVCRCKPGFIDLSTNPRHEAGIVCKKLIDECGRAELNTCHPDAICVDTHDSYKCICKPGYDDLDEFRNPGRQCVKVQRPSKCQEEGKRQCDKNARCFYDEQNDKLECVCPPNFRDKSPDPILKPGRVCIPLIPECDNPTLNDCDSPDRAICTDTDEGYMCRCRQGFLDISPNITIKPGRLCKSLENECVKGSHDCARDGGICEDTPDSYTCRCAANFLDVSLDRKNRPGRNCKRLIDECASGQNDCFPGALCTDTEDSYTCACPPNHLDVSPDPVKRPGRRCLLRVNECNVQGLSDCSPNANCQDTDEGYNCTCADGFVDESPDRRKRPGRVCRPALVDECQLRQHDCHSDAQCVDLAHGFTCQCLPQFLDESPDRVTHPGRLCVPRPTQAPEECQLGAGAGCNETLHEVCRVIGGVPKCSCPINYERDSTSRACTVIDECQFPQLNDCHPSSECLDLAQGFTCKCRSGFRDVSPTKEKPGRVCRAMVNECQFAHLNDCHQNAQCLDLEDGYQCKCESGFKDVRPERPGRLCQQMVNECARADTNSCDKNAKCLDEENGYRCECKSDFADVSPTPTLPGRACRPIVNECAESKLNDCDRLAKCVDMEDGYRCECPAKSRDISPSPAFPGRVCHVFENECLTGKHDCDPQALCHDNEQAFTCECPEGFTDRSPNKQHRPGRVCVKLVDECKEEHDTCSPNAECRDLEEGYTCECRDGYVDRSPNLAVQPGRVCGAPETCPANHDCSAAAVCEPQGGSKYTCTCIQGYVDQSPDGLQGRICVRNSFCRDPKLNNCSRKAVCYEEGQGYRCECARGYVDKSPDGTPKGRVCELPPAPAQPQRHPCQDGSHDCHTKASCRAVGATGFVCECLPGYEDKSPDPKNKGGRVCLLTEPICLDNTRNDCHPAAICAENAQASGGFTCRCRDGYVDQSPDKERKAGRICVEYVNECLDRSLNDCDPLAVCEDLADGYTCRCAHGAIDQSPDKRRPGRKCFAQINECANPSLNNCSRFADCFDKAEGFECRCRAEYHDEDPKQPGTSCKYMQNECLNPALNDCSPNAECIDLAGGYICKCKAPNEDKGPKELPGRVCLFNECADPKVNKCDKNAHCEDTEDGYNCRCNEGFYDESASKGQPAGHYCIDYQFGNEATPVVEQKPQQTLKVPGTPCGHNNWCLEERKEVCVGGVRCLCRPGEGRGAADQKCVPVERTSLAIRVSGQAQKPLFYNSEYGDSTSSSYVELVHEFQRDIGRAVGNTSLAPRYVTSDVSYVTHPKAFNSSWSDGLLINFTIGTHRGNEPIDRCELWKQLISSLHRSNGSIGNGRLSVASDVGLLDPCAKPAPPGEQCNGAVCKQSLGEVCIGGELCGCPTGQKRASADDQCRLVESFTIPLWVLRRGVHNLVFNSTFANPIDQLNKEYVRQFSTGVAQCYPHTALRGSFVVAEVNEILDPMFVNASWDTGLLFNATMSFRKGTVRVPADAYNALIRYVIDRNGNQLGSSGLFLSPYQQNPFSACFKNNCHPKGICVELGPNAYRCECSAEQRDLNPADPGRKCVPTRGYNECEREEDNECSENARCIDLEYLYKCECLRGYTDAAPKGSVPGSLCMLDYCSDVSYCPANSTCVNTALQAECHCNNGFTDIRRSESRLSMGLSPDQYCLNVRDIDECALGLHNCSAYATCTNLPDGYTCQCPAGWEDGNPELPGRICASKLCAQCSEHGSCIPDPANSTNVVCQCFDGYAGTFCEISPSALPLVLAIILALLFLLLALWSLLFLCTKCRCFKRRRDFSALDQSASSESGADFTSLYGGIPRPKLKSSSGADSTDVHAARLANYLDDGLRIPRAQLGHDTSSLGSAGGSSEYTIREEIERRVITDVTRTEEIVTDVDVHDESGGGGGAGGQNATATSTRLFQSSGGSGGGSAKASTSVNVIRSGDFVGGERRRVDERERDESVAEFANSRGAGGWGGTSASTNAGGGTQLDDHHQRRHGGRNGADGGERHNRAFAMVGEEERSLGGELSADDLSIYDKNTMMSRHREFHPMDGGMERFSTSEVSTTKTKKTSREMRK